MSLTPAMLDAMVAAGCSAEQIAAVVKAAMSDEDTRRAEKRAKDAERQRRHRASRNVTVTERDESGQSVTGVTPPVPPPNAPHTPQTPPPISPPTTKGARARGAALPADWQPNDAHRSLVADAGLPPAFLADQAERLRDWALANQNRSVGRKADWDATFRNWLREAIAKRRDRPQPRAAPKAQSRDGYADVLDMLEATDEPDHSHPAEPHRDDLHRPAPFDRDARRPLVERGGAGPGRVVDLAPLRAEPRRA